MSTVIASMSAQLGLNTSGFQREAKTAEATWTRMIRRMERETKLEFPALQRRLFEESGTKSIPMQLREVNQGLGLGPGRMKVGEMAAQRAGYMGAGPLGLGQELQPIMQATGQIDEGFKRANFTLRGMAKTAGVVAAGIEAAGVITKVWQGDITGAADQIKSLPFGVGHLASTLEDMLGAWTGATKEIERNKKAAEALESSFTAIRTFSREHRDNLAEVGRMEARAAMAPGLMGMPPAERAGIEGRLDLEDRMLAERKRTAGEIKTIDAEIAKASENLRNMDPFLRENRPVAVGTTPGTFRNPEMQSVAVGPNPAYIAMEKNIAKLGKQREEAVGIGFRREMAAWRSGEAQMGEMIGRMVLQEAQQEERARKDKEAMLADLQAQAAVKRQRLAGDELGAELAQIQADAEARKRVATTEERGLIESLSQLDQELARKRAADREATERERLAGEQQRAAEQWERTMQGMERELEGIQGRERASQIDVMTKQLQAQGKTLEADVISTWVRYEDQIRAARKAGEEFTAQQLEKSRELDLQAIAKRQSGRDLMGVGMFERGTRSLEGMQIAAGSAQARVERVVELGPKTVAELARIYQNAERIPVAAN